MFFQFNGQITEISADRFDPSKLTAAFVTVDELIAAADTLGFPRSAAESCVVSSGHFRSGVEVYDDYTFTELRIMSRLGEAEDDCVALLIKKNLMLVVDVEDRDGSTKEKFTTTLKRFSPENVTLEKLIYAFLDSLVSQDVRELERMSVELSGLEEQLHDGKAQKDFSVTLFNIKKLLLRYHNYYEQIIDITETLDENENDIFDSDSLMYINNADKKTERLKEDADSLRNTVEHLQDAYSSYLDAKLNNTMKRFTVITTVFFPLTIIVGWYGMNFQSMPEFAWRYGYIYVILLSVLTVAVLTVVGKIKKWF